MRSSSSVYFGVIVKCIEDCPSSQPCTDFCFCHSKHRGPIPSPSLLLLFFPIITLAYSFPPFLSLVLTHRLLPASDTPFSPRPFPRRPASPSDDCLAHFIWRKRQRAEHSCGFSCVIWNINAGIIQLPGRGAEVDVGGCEGWWALSNHQWLPFSSPEGR